MVKIFIRAFRHSYLAALLLITLGADAQKYTNNPGYFSADSYWGKNNIRPGIRDTAVVSGKVDSIGSVIYWPATKALWVRTDTGWAKVGSGFNISDYVPTTRLINTTSPISGGGDLSNDITISIANAQADGENKGAATFQPNHFDDDGAGAIELDTINGPGYTKYAADSFFLKRKPSRIYPYANAKSYALQPSTSRLPLASDIELINFGNTAGLSYTIYQNPMALWANNWAMGFGVNVQYDSTAKRYKIFNKEYPVSYYEAGWEGVTLHTVPANQADSVDLYPHEAFQARPGIDGSPLLDVNRQYNQIKATLVARYDTSFNWQSTAYGWWGQDSRPFQWFFTERNMSNGNRFADFATYMTAATSAAKFEFSRSRGTYSAQTAVQSGDTLGNIMFRGHDGTSMLNVGRVYATATANAATNNAPTAVTVRASNGASTAGTTTITSAGGFGINNTSPSSALHIVKEGFGGLIYIDRYSTGIANLPPSVYGIASNGSLASPSAVVKNDRLLSLNGGGYDGSSLDRNSRGSVSILADTNWSTTAKSTRFDIHLTNVVDDSRKVFSIDHRGHAGVGDTTDIDAMLLVQGSIKAGANTYSSGGYGMLVRNTTSGMYESVSSTTYAPSAANGYVELSPVSRQSGSISINTSSSLVSTGNALWSIGQTTATPTNLAGVQVDGVNGDFVGADYLSLLQLQTGHAALRNFNSSGNLTLGSGSSTSTNITLKPSNVSTFGGAVEVPNRTVTGNTTLNDGDRTVFVNNTGTVTITLPTAVGKKGRRYTVKKISAASNDVNIDQTGSETIDNSTSAKTLTLQWSAITFESDNAAWLVVGAYAAATTL